MSFKVAIFTLNQWALDFTGNTERIIKSIDQAHQAEADYRAGPELELCGYSLEDAFYEQDTVLHSWECLLRILKHSRDIDMIIDIGMPIQNGSLYNCRVITYRGKILCIRAKTILAIEGNYREFRHFSPWKSGLVAYRLPRFVGVELGQEHVPFGADFILEVSHSSKDCDTLKVGWEICQELWDANNVSSALAHDFGCHLILNGSGSYWELRKLNTVLDMIKGISLRGGCCYAFANSIGCDGQRYVFYGRSCIYDRGQLVTISSDPSYLLDEVNMVTHMVNVRELDENRAQLGIRPDRASLDGPAWDLLKQTDECGTKLSGSIKRLYLQLPTKSTLETTELISRYTQVSVRFELEINLFASLWLWDYLRRSKMVGFMMPLSGGLDSTTVAVLVFSMCNHVHNNLDKAHVQEYFRQVHKIEPSEVRNVLKTPKDLCRLILKCSYLSTKYSSQATRRRAEALCESLNAEFISLSIDDTYENFRSSLSGQQPGGEVSLLDQNLQARLRMSATYYLSGGNRIVLATGNVDEGIMGYLTKYDCSSADINPIGGMCKNDLRCYLKYCCDELFKGESQLVETLREIITAPPSAELTGAEQRDEDEIGITYDEISVLGRVRRGLYGCSGPRGAFETVWNKRNSEPFANNIRCLRNNQLSTQEKAIELAALIKRFYTRFSRNRHKLTVLTPALHTETYSPDDNRFDHRHFLYAPWTEQFNSIDSLVDEIKSQCS